LQRIPRQGEQIKYKDLKLAITRMKGVKIEEVLVTREKTTAAESQTSSPEASGKANAAPPD